MHQPATIKDVALKAGCGVATVSRVLNNTGSASTEMRKRVTAAVRELDFQFSEVGRSLQSSKTRTIGFVVPSIANPVYADALQGAQEVLTISGYQMLLICTNYSPESELSAIRTLISKQVAGIVLTVSDAERSQGLSIIKDRRLPYCLLYNNTSVNQESWSVDDEAAAKRVAQAFSENLHNQTGFLALNFNKSDRARQRYEGYCAGCKARGMKKPKLLEISEDFENLTLQLKQFLSENPSITGIFASNDFLALAIIRSARKLALNVPRDLSIIGFDGIDVGLMVEPTLATIVTDPKMLGAGAGKAVLSFINKTEVLKPPPAYQTFNFRAGGSIAHLGAESSDDGKLTDFPSSFDPTK
jgi:DNA-binding LacI/PurR family transcriptional regulator